jgi:uncharacterized protein (DUF2461 family)
MRIHFEDRSVTYNQFLDDVAKKVAFLVWKDINKKMAEQPEMVTTEEAARILNITPDWLRHIKDRFPHIKTGDTKQGKLLFVRDALLTSR